MVNECLIQCMAGGRSEMQESPDFRAQLTSDAAQAHPVEKRIVTAMARI
jgi:hypothetical protein